MRDERIWVFSENGLKPTRFETSVWDEPIIPTWAHRSHKNEKPIKLMTRFVSWLPADTVLDPFMGSGTTLVAAKNLGRKAIGIEIEEKYCEIAVQRLGQEVMPL
jgi:site-specific DNA-methyltransferase (adenine-specific)